MQRICRFPRREILQSSRSRILLLLGSLKEGRDIKWGSWPLMMWWLQGLSSTWTLPPCYAPVFRGQTAPSKLLNWKTSSCVVSSALCGERDQGAPNDTLGACLYTQLSGIRGRILCPKVFVTSKELRRAQGGRLSLKFRPVYLKAGSSSRC